VSDPLDPFHHRPGPPDGDPGAPRDASADAPTTSYMPPVAPVEPRTTWAGSWPNQTPQHWLEPMPGRGAEHVEPRRERKGVGVGVLFVVAMVASILGSALTYGGLMVTNQLGASPSGVAAGSPSPTTAPETQPPPAPQTPAAGVTDDISAAAQRVSPAVVTITVREGEATDPFSLPETGVGSGIIYDPDGWVLTNRHVVSDATQVTVELTDGRQVQGRVYGVDTLTDLAIVKIDATDPLPSAPIGDSSTLRPGQTAIVIGSPLGTFTNSVTSGVISALGRQIVAADPVTNDQRRLRNLIQTDAAINPGNSGGPLLDAAGNVVGVSTALAQQAQGIFFAIPINIAKPIMRQAIAGEPLTRPWIGIVYIALDRNVADENELPIDYGAWISPETGSGASPIVPDSPAEQAGLQANDIITSIDGQRIDAGQTLDDILSLYGPQDELTLEVLRNGATINVPVTLGTRPAGLD
jgi:S1-C subfamily serine protease